MGCRARSSRRTRRGAGRASASSWALGVHNENLKFGTASFDKVPLLKEYQGRVKPVFLIFKDSKRVASVEGVDLPAIKQALSA